MSYPKSPFANLGHHLKYVREQSRQSLSEVSGAVEIDEEHLQRIESGVERPAEDVLLLLISHFGVQDREAEQLWESAEYEGDMPEEIKLGSHSPHPGSKPIVMLLAMDIRTMYSDGLEVTVNPAGVSLNFTQATGQDKPAPVARVGMSHQQARQVIHDLEQALLRSKYLSSTKLLPPNL